MRFWVKWACMCIKPLNIYWGNVNCCELDDLRSSEDRKLQLIWSVINIPNLIDYIITQKKYIFINHFIALQNFSICHSLPFATGEMCPKCAMDRKLFNHYFVTEWISYSDLPNNLTALLTLFPILVNILPKETNRLDY